MNRRHTRLNRRARTCFFSVICASFVVTGFPADSTASPRDRAFGLSIAGSAFPGTNTQYGGTLGLDYGKGLSRLLPLVGQIELRGGVSYRDDLRYFGGGLLSFKYTLDATEKAPFVGLGAGALFVGGDGIDADIVPRIELSLGIDFQSSDSFAWGIIMRAEIASPWDINQTGFLAIGLRTSWQWRKR